MALITTVKEMELDDALEHLEAGAALIDLRPVDEYLAKHVAGSLALVYEFGPGMAGRARDCLPLSLPLLLLPLAGVDMRHVAGALRGKGFDVVGVVTDGRLEAWGGRRDDLKRTDVWVAGEDELPVGTLLDVGDTGASPPEGAVRMPIERLHATAGELAGEELVVVVAGYGVRAALAVGWLERAGVGSVGFLKSNTGLMAGALSGRHGHPSVR